MCFSSYPTLLEANARTAIVEKTAGYVARNGQVFERTFFLSPSSLFPRADSW